MKRDKKGLLIPESLEDLAKLSSPPKKPKGRMRRWKMPKKSRRRRKKA